MVNLKVSNRFKYRPGARSNQQQEQSSWLLDHLCEKHPQQIEELNPCTGVKFKVLKEIRDPFTRQTEEACRIQEAINGKKSGAAAVGVHLIFGLDDFCHYVTTYQMEGVINM